MNKTENFLEEYEEAVSSVLEAVPLVGAALRAAPSAISTYYDKKLLEALFKENFDESLKAEVFSYWARSSTQASYRRLQAFRRLIAKLSVSEVETLALLQILSRLSDNSLIVLIRLAEDPKSLVEIEATYHAASENALSVMGWCEVVAQHSGLKHHEITEEVFKELSDVKILVRELGTASSGTYLAESAHGLAFTGLGAAVIKQLS